jgi:predicted nuclease of predicted toxin-antitoxin system
VPDEGLGGTDDDALFARCRREGRCLVTLDLDFGNVLRFPPEKTAGLAVLRPAGRPSLAALERLIGQLVETLSREPVAGRLWIIEPGRVRIHESPEAE